jgi:hypothetical protein
MLGHSIGMLLDRFNVEVLLVVVGFVFSILAIVMWNVFKNLFDLLLLDGSRLFDVVRSPFSATFTAIAKFKLVRKNHFPLRSGKLIIVKLLLRLGVVSYSSSSITLVTCGKSLADVD